MLTIDASLGKPLAKVGNRIVSVITSKAEIKANDIAVKTSFNLDPEGDAQFVQAVNTTTEREILYIFGPSGSGKSTYTVEYLKQYKKTYPKRSIYVLSALTEDVTLDKVPGLKRLKINERLISEPLKAEQFQDACLVLDDTDCISDVGIRKAVLAIAGECLELGRHFNNTLIFTSHLSSAGKDTRKIWNECTSVTYFPSAGAVKGIYYALQNYVGMEKKQIDEAKKSGSRWVTVFKTYPQVIMGQHFIKMLSED